MRVRRRRLKVPADRYVTCPPLTHNEARALTRAADFMRLMRDSVAPEFAGECRELSGAALKLTVGMERAGCPNEMLGWTP